MNETMPHGSTRWSVILGSALAGLGLSNCGLLGPSVDRFIIHVDSISAPSAVSASDTFKVRFRGGIGPDGCWYLAGVDRQVTHTSLELRFRGEHKVGGGGYDCPQMAVALDYADVVPPPIGAPFTITVRQPDGSMLRRVVAAQ